MSLFARTYDRLMYGMAWCAGFLMGAMMISICIDVVLRNLGFQSSAHLFTFTEYALLIIPCLGAPWLVRERGHVYVEIVLMHLSETNRHRMGIVIGVFCIVVCAVLAWYGFDVTWTNYVRRDVDVRSMDMPRWMIVIFIPLSFAMMAGEFARHMLRGTSVLGDMASAVVLKDSTPVEDNSADETLPAPAFFKHSAGGTGGATADGSGPATGTNGASNKSGGVQ